MQFAYPLPFGAALLPGGQARFRLWAPACDAVSLLVRDAPAQPMRREADGWFMLETAAEAGTRYRYLLSDGLAVPDPAARLQDGDVHGWSVVFDPLAHDWRNGDWRGRPWTDAVVYEVHTGLLGGFNGVGRQLERLRDFGITAIELMPVNDFPGARNWGYDGVLPYAPDEAYGTPGELKALVDRAHGLGLMMFLDVVYNHFGPDGAYQHVYGGKYFFDEGRHSPWGAAIDFSRSQVREYFIENAIYWLQEYRFDGLRFDAVHAYENAEFADAMAAAVRQAVGPDRQVHLVAEHEGNVVRHLRPGLFDAQWADDTHHALHVMLTGETDGYYGDFADAAPRLARSLAEGFAFQGEMTRGGHPRGEASGDLPPSAFVICLQNHDQIGNRAIGERLTVLADAEALRAAYALLLLTPQIPLLFMGELDGSTAPFLFFTDHNAELAALVRDGRRREFAHFPAFADEKRREAIPDPNAEATYLLSRPEDGDPDPQMQAHLRTLLGLRQRHLLPRLSGAASLGAQDLGERAVLARWALGDGSELIVACNLAPEPVTAPALDGPRLFESHPGDAMALSEGRLAPHSTVVLLLERT